MSQSKDDGSWVWMLALLCLGILMILAAVHDYGHTSCYLVGAQTAQTYYETTGEWPSRQWLRDQHPLKAETVEDIWRTLRPYEQEAE